MPVLDTRTSDGSAQWCCRWMFLCRAHNVSALGPERDKCAATAANKEALSHTTVSHTTISFHSESANRRLLLPKPPSNSIHSCRRQLHLHLQSCTCALKVKGTTLDGRPVLPTTTAANHVAELRSRPAITANHSPCRPQLPPPVGASPPPPPPSLQTGAHFKLHCFECNGESPRGSRAR